MIFIPALRFGLPVLCLAALLASCNDSERAPNDDGLGGNAEAGAAGAGASTGGEASTAGGASAGAAPINAGSSGSSGTGAGGGAAGAAAASVAGAAGAATGGSSGNANDAAVQVEPPWECPDAPFPDPEVGEVETVCADFDFAFNYLEGTTWVKADSALYFTNFDIYSGMGGDIVKYTVGGGCEVFAPDVGCTGLAVGRAGTLLGACQQPRSVQSFDLLTKAVTPVASAFMGSMLDTPNDLVMHTNGAIYFTNRIAELDGRPVAFGSALFWIDPEGTLDLIEMGDGNGIALSPDERTLYVNNLGTWELDEDGVPGAAGPNLVSGDGLAVDCAGNLYQNDGQILNPEGEQIGSFPGGTNMAFGGSDGKTLFVVSGGTSVRALQMNIPGLP